MIAYLKPSVHIAIRKVVFLSRKFMEHRRPVLRILVTTRPFGDLCTQLPRRFLRRTLGTPQSLLVVSYKSHPKWRVVVKDSTGV